MKNEYGAFVEWHWQDETEVLGEWPAPVSVFFFHQKLHMDWPGVEEGTAR